MFGISFFTLLLAILGIYIAKTILFRNNAPLPPGPKPKPIVGNRSDLPPAGLQDWQHWLKYGDLYGPISSITVLGRTIIFINDVQVATEILEKRSSLNSSRPRMVFRNEMVGFGNFMIGPLPPDRFRAYRKAVHSVVGTKKAVAQFDSVQDIEVRRFLLRVLEKPKDLSQHIRTEVGALILRIAYDYAIEAHKKDPLINIADEVLLRFGQASVPGAWLVDLFPALKYIPDWFPGAGFKRTAKEWNKTVVELAEKPYNLVRRRMVEGKQRPCYLSKLLKDGNISTEEDHAAKWTAVSLYSAGSETTIATINCFFLAMTLYPEVQLKAQEEIDRIVGIKRLPNIEDRANLPYVDAIVKEVLRWHPVAPMGLPHMTTEDDMFNKYFIPKGALIFANLWAINHDPKVYHDPSVFKPERFLSSPGHEPEPDPHNVSFGFGRRICPGRVLADSIIYLTIVQSLAVFTVSKAVEAGKEIEPVVQFSATLISYPAPYQTSIKPRSPEHEALVRVVEAEHPWEESDWKYL